MLGHVNAAVLRGIDAQPISVEVDLAGGLPTIAAIGLPDPAVREGIDRVRSALANSGFDLPARRVVINLAPAETPKRGSALDLAIAVAILVADGRVPARGVRGAMLCGELALDGRLRPVRGAMAMTLAARREGLGRVVVPEANGDEAALVGGIDVFVAASLREAIDRLAAGREPFRAPPVAERLAAARDADAPDLRDVRGQDAARRALEIAAAGGHHLLLVGPPGAGKTMLARRLPGILPPLEEDEALDATRIHGAAGVGRGLVLARPFRAPHHGVSTAGMTGGGVPLRPGEMTLASHGVLYLDELPEFRREPLEALRQPLEAGEVRVVRQRESATFPARFQLVASMNPCPCGHADAGDGRCICTPHRVAAYRGRVSGPLLDRFDLVCTLPALRARDLEGTAGEASAAVRERVVRARARQRRRNPPSRATNAHLTRADLLEGRAGPPPDASARQVLDAALDRLGLSMRAYDRVLRLARTIADLDGEEAPGRRGLLEALQYRRRLDSGAETAGTES